MNPILVEPSVSYSFLESLQHCHKMKIDYRSIQMNLILVVVFVVGIAGFLYYKRKTRPTPRDKKYKQEQDRLYILGKLKSLQLEKNHSMQGLITDLPVHQYI